MKIKAAYFGLAGAITIGLVFASLATMMTLWPTATLKFIGTTHMIPKLELLTPYLKTTPIDLALGFSTHVIAAFIIFWLIATFYNIMER
jgi:hypothetical protein